MCQTCQISEREKSWNFFSLPITFRMHNHTHIHTNTHCYVSSIVWKRCCCCCLAFGNCPEIRKFSIVLRKRQKKKIHIIELFAFFSVFARKGTFRCTHIHTRLLGWQSLSERNNSSQLIVRPHRPGHVNGVHHRNTQFPGKRNSLVKRFNYVHNSSGAHTKHLLISKPIVVGGKPDFFF
jgi:hypothetical protein